MIQPTFAICVALVCLGGMSGFVNAIAGGGGLLTLPALMLLGLSPAQALATNKLQLVFGPIAALPNFFRAGLVLPGFAFSVSLFAFAGALAGACTVQMLDQAVLSWLVPALLVGPVLYVTLCPCPDEIGRARLAHPLFAALVGTALGFYDGFFGPGGGLLWMTALISLAGLNIRQAAANANVFAFASTAAGLLMFAAGGQIVVWVGLLMGVGQLLGGWLGARMVVLHGARWIRPLVTLATIGATAKLLIGDQAILSAQRLLVSLVAV